MAAAAVCLARGVDRRRGARGRCATFAGVPHRLEEIADGRRRDSTSTTPRRRTSPRPRSASGPSRGGVHLIVGGRGKGSDYAPLAGPVRERCRAVYLIGETAAALRAALAPTGVPLTDAGDLERAVAAAQRGGRAGRRRAALAGLRVLRPVPLLRGARRALPRGSSPALAIKARKASGPSCRMAGPMGEDAAAARAPTAAHRHLLPAGGRRGDGLLGLVGADAAAGRGRRHDVPGQVRRLRRGRPDRDARDLAAGPRARSARYTTAAAAGRVRAAGAGQDPGHRRRGQRRAPLARRSARCSSSRARS